MSGSVGKISEKNCIDIIMKLQALEMIELIYTQDAKQYGSAALHACTAPLCWHCPSLPRRTTRSPCAATRTGVLSPLPQE